ncbi:MAG TPA: bifunctional glycosyltransferase family 2 protein/CDP-glycerol:glycerophosphate glycerophosphotransferase [Streptosporangiaceae bacterium]|nr:bifunctional glycosyltransferase family 2 protein/CDP-glycerol:glycerophosphate glycerophosphotransferase [Streptosporangiaceae bacterium]
MTVPRISVVVPFYNNEDLLDDCLASIAGQTFTDLEVIMVDDGSSDGSADIARARAAADPRFSLVQVPNGGPGYARNRGVERATGTYLAFVDADDALPSHAYEYMLHTLEESGSDFVSGAVQRLGPLGVTNSAMHSRAIKGRKIGTHISKTPDLFWDVSVWNKLFRKSFWDLHGLTYPEVMAWEDLQIITRAHVLAKAVDTIPMPIYYWRERGKGALSITQSRTDIGNYRDRIHALLVIDSFLREHKPHKMVAQHQRKALINDVWLYVGELPRTDDAYRAEFMELTQRYLAQVEKRVFPRLPSPQRLAYHLISEGRFDQLLEFVMWRREQPIRTIPVVRERGRLRADLPFRGDPELKVPDSMYKPHWRELDPFVRVESVEWEGDNLVLGGAAFVPSVDITKRRHASKVVVLVPRGGKRLPVVVPARSVEHSYATGWSRQDRYSYDWAGFRAVISPRWFRPAGKWLTGDWDGYILVRGRGIWRPARLHTPVLGPAERPEMRQVAPGVRFGVRWVDRRLHVQVREIPAVLHSCEQAGDQLRLAVDIDEPAKVAGRLPDSRLDLVLRWSKGAAEQPLAATVERTATGGIRLQAAVSNADLLRPLSPAGVSGLAMGRDEEVEWDLYVVASKGNNQNRTRVAFADGFPEYSYLADSREIIVARTRYGNAVIVRRGELPVIEEHAWSPDGTLTLTGRYAGAAGHECEAVLTRRGSTDRHVIAMPRDGEKFTLTIPVTAMPSFGRQLPMRDGTWLFGVRQVGQTDEQLIRPVFDHSRLREVSDKRMTFGPKAYRFTSSGYDSPIMTIGPALKLVEGGRVQRKVLRSVYYPVQQRLPVRDAVMFISWKGKQCGDNPRGIADELRRRGDAREHLWVVNDWAIPAPDGSTPLLVGTDEYYEALARSKYVISNDDMPAWYTKRDGQVYVQTWHGTPLKRIGFDVEQPQFISGTKYLDHLEQEVLKWDLLLSPNPFSTPIMRQAFRFDGEICESGYPRNDVLCSGDSAHIAERTRARLGIAEGKRVIMYAPTWRDNQYYASGRYRFDFRLDLEDAWQRLGDDYVILVRGHHHMADDVPAGIRPGFVINVTPYPDISELFLASDALITDYSSVMFDYAPTGKPLLFFTYDLEQYRDNLRGFYFDFEADAPGPLLETSAAVIDSLGNLDAVQAQHADAYRAFTGKFCPLDDGKAGARACDRIFGG